MTNQLLKYKYNQNHKISLYNETNKNIEDRATAYIFPGITIYQLIQFM